MDFIVDGLANGRMVRILSVVDAFTRECLTLEADTSLGSGRVTRALDRLIEERGLPENVRSDNGPGFTSRRMLGWAESWLARRHTPTIRRFPCWRPATARPRPADYGRISAMTAPPATRWLTQCRPGDCLCAYRHPFAVHTDVHTHRLIFLSQKSSRGPLRVDTCQSAAAGLRIIGYILI